MFFDLISSGADKPVRLSEIFDNPYGDALALAILKRDDAELSRLLGHGSGARTKGHHGITPLWIAVELHNDVATEMLLKAGADPNAPLDWVKPILISALAQAYPHPNEEQSLRILDLLLAAGADPNVSYDNSGNVNPAIFSVYNSRGTLQKLLDAGADIDAVDSYGTSLLMAKVTKSDLPYLLDLLDMGADPSIVSKSGITFISLVDIWLRRNPEDKEDFAPVFTKLKAMGYDLDELRKATTSPAHK